jgi:hypothetical protein
MKLFLLSAVILFFLFNISCDSNDSIVGSNQDTSISNLLFTVDTTYLNSSGGVLVASGIVKNRSNNMVESPWYVEAQFYTDRSLRTKLGGNYTQIGVPLSRDQSTFWTISFSSSNVDVRNYPNFAVSDLRGIYK